MRWCLRSAKGSWYVTSPSHSPPAARNHWRRSPGTSAAVSTARGPGSGTGIGASPAGEEWRELDPDRPVHLLAVTGHATDARTHVRNSTAVCRKLSWCSLRLAWPQGAYL